MVTSNLKQIDLHGLYQYISSHQKVLYATDCKDTISLVNNIFIYNTCLCLDMVSVVGFEPTLT